MPFNRLAEPAGLWAGLRTELENVARKYLIFQPLITSLGWKFPYIFRTRTFKTEIEVLLAKTLSINFLDKILLNFHAFPWGSTFTYSNTAGRQDRSLIWQSGYIRSSLLRKKKRKIDKPWRGPRKFIA